MISGIADAADFGGFVAFPFLLVEFGVEVFEVCGIEEIYECVAYVTVILCYLLNFVRLYQLVNRKNRIYFRSFWRTIREAFIECTYLGCF